MLHGIESPAALAGANRAQDSFTKRTENIPLAGTFQAPSAFNHATERLVRHYRLTPPTARLICTLSGLGGRAR